MWDITNTHFRVQWMNLTEIIICHIDGIISTPKPTP